MTSEKVIQVADLAKKYKHSEAVRGISFEVFKGEIFGILGPNGAGKTTTLEIIECLKKQTAGKCEVLGLDNLAKPEQIKKRIGVQLQSSEYLNLLTLGELIQLFASLYKTKVDPIEVLKKVNLEEKVDALVKELSGGQKQRFTIATALVNKPEILFLDEPTTGLDPQARRDMWNLVKEINAQGTTIVLTTHYMEEAEYLCHRVAIMDQGKILKLDNPQKLIEELSKIYKLSFFVDQKLEPNFFEGIAGIRNVFNEYPKIVMEIDGLEPLAKITERLGEHNIKHSFLNLKTATLEDVYLELTGHEYEE